LFYHYKCLLFIAFVLLINPKVTNAQEYFQPFEKNILKFSPYFIGVSYKGVSLMYETGSGWRFLSLQVNYRYAMGPNNADSLSNSLQNESEHHRLEIMPRIWLLRHMNFFYVGPYVAFYDKGYQSVGGVFGFQQVIAEHICLEIFAGIQSNNVAENKNFKINKQPIFARVGITLGYQFYTIKKSKTRSLN